jgi:hypothetical protein
MHLSLFENGFVNAKIFDFNNVDFDDSGFNDTIVAINDPQITPIFCV